MYQIQLVYKIKQNSINNSNKDAILSQGRGLCLQYIEFDGKLYWTIN